MNILEVLMRPVIVMWDKLDEWADIDTEADEVSSPVPTPAHTETPEKL